MGKQTSIMCVCSHYSFVRVAECWRNPVRKPPPLPGGVTRNGYTILFVVGNRTEIERGNEIALQFNFIEVNSWIALAYAGETFRALETKLQFSRQ